MTVQALLFITCVLASAYGSYNFMDCAGNMNTWGFLRRCCTNGQLPKGCECFDISYSSDFTNTFFHRPHCPRTMKVRFFLYTRDKDEKTPIKVGDSSISSSTFKGSRPTKFITHGFADHTPAPWTDGIKRAFLEEEDLNVIVVNWRTGAMAPNYFQAVANTRSVGAMVAKLIQELHQTMGASLQSFHLIGHSLGAHVSGIAGKEIHRLTSELVGRITGLDPAGPLYESYSANVRLDKSDAAFVDVIHTDAEPLISSGFGIRRSIGHADFFPNGGQHQPGCPTEHGGILSMLDFESEFSVGACSHSRCIEYFTYSIQKCRYDPPNGDDKCTMGYHCSTSCRGDYFPETTDKPPYC